jgi:general secretion pathway protein E
MSSAHIPTNAVSFINKEDFPKVPFVISGLSSRFVLDNKFIPVEFKNNVFKVIMASPDNEDTINALKVSLRADVVVYSSDAQAIDEYLTRYYGQESQNINRIIEDIGAGDIEIVKDEEDIGHLKDLASEAPIIKLVNTLITRAVESRASDIHIEPFEDELRVRYRIDGILHDIESLPKKLQPAIVSRVKIMAKLNIAERRLPQDGRIRLKVSDTEIDIRVSTIPVIYGESVVMRILRKEGIVIDLELLGFSSDTLSGFISLIKKPNGIILVTGPTGSGKTTTLYGALDKINSPDKKIITVEDPVEYQLKGINQIHVKPQIGLNFANTLRHIVRQDPDVIMIGEIRDLETAEIAIQSSLTGHLVFSTLHTNDAPSSITRLLDMGVENFLLSSTVRGILAQRLVRVICPKCKKEDESSVEIPELSSPGIISEIRGFYGRGCDYCAGTGFYGRTGIFELLIIDDDIRKLVLRSADSNQIREAGKQKGMKTLLEDGIEKVRTGMTTASEVLRVTQE